jgi:hypothetical protein
MAGTLSSEADIPRRAQGWREKGARIMLGAELSWGPEYARDLDALGDALRSAMKPAEVKQ